MNRHLNLLGKESPAVGLDQKKFVMKLTISLQSLKRNPKSKLQALQSSSSLETLSYDPSKHPIPLTRT
jgi:hypothetical protein